MLKIKTKYDFWKKIKVSSPAEDGGMETTEFEVKFLYDPKGSKKIMAEIMQALPAEQERLGVEFMTSSITDWRNVGGADGQKKAFDSDALKDMLEIPWIARAILDAWTESINGNPALGN